MHILITGATGFVGTQLVNRLLADSNHGLGTITQLTLVDTRFPHPCTDSRVRRVEGSIADRGVLEAALCEPADLVFHLASIAGGRAENDFALGLDVNLLATLTLLEILAEQTTPARLVYSSTIAVFGANLPSLVDDDTPKRPGLSYGAHKLCAEILIDDYSRRGLFDGRIVRLPGIVARAADAGLLSAFMSDIFFSFAQHRPFISPVSAEATMWMMSVACCADNLLVAAAIDPGRLSARRDFTLPALRTTMADLVDALGSCFGPAPVTYAPIPALEAAFGRLPELDCRPAQALGFRHDGTLEALIRNAMPERLLATQ
jgi:nucleoside-diphosphate-sugar epimerase